jgi:hypothetical protein
MTEDTVSYGDEDRKLLQRRSILTTAGLGTVAAGLAVAVPGVASASTRMVTADSRKNAGAGMYASPNTVMQMSSFTIDPHGVTCGVGTIAANLADVADMLPMTVPLPPLSHSGAFAMHMAAVNVTSYKVDSATGTIVARGRMRSVTQAGDITLEDVEHNYHAIGIDGRGDKPSFFATSFKTPFWNTGNPMATKSKFVDGFVMFGGHLIMGEISVS